jgi:phospholipid-translocating ATPase
VKESGGGGDSGLMSNVALVMSGSIINHCNDCHRLRNSLLKLCRYSKTVICYRVEPWQKSRLVEMIRNKESNVVTLAIGDGSNDVPMLQGRRTKFNSNSLRTLMTLYETT